MNDNNFVNEWQNASVSSIHRMVRKIMSKLTLQQLEDQSGKSRQSWWLWSTTNRKPELDSYLKIKEMYQRLEP